MYFFSVLLYCANGSDEPPAKRRRIESECRQDSPPLDQTGNFTPFPVTPPDNQCVQTLVPPTPGEQYNTDLTKSADALMVAARKLFTGHDLGRFARLVNREIKFSTLIPELTLSQLDF